MVRVETRRSSVTARLGWWAAALIPLLLGSVLRFHYLVQAEPFVDEPTTLLVARAIAHSGLPILPSGLFYGNDLVFSYVAGALVAVAGANLVVLRAFSLAASLLTIGLLYLAGSLGLARVAGEKASLGRAWSWIGLWAAIFLALSPEAIVWGTRARAYALLQLLAFLAVWLFSRGLLAGKDGERRLGLVLLVAAVYVHPEAALLLPALVVGTMLVQGWRCWFQPGRLAELALVTVASALRLWLQLVLARGQIGGFDTPTGSRPPVELFRDLPARFQAISPFFLDGERLAWTLLSLIALTAAVWTARRSRPDRTWRPVFLFSACLWLVPLGMILVLGSTYASPRYLGVLLPIFALLAATGLQVLISGLSRFIQRYRWQGVLPGLATVALIAASVPGAWAGANTPEKGFRSAFEYVAAHWQPGDQVATVAPAYCQLVLGSCDFFSLGQDYEEFVYRAADGQWRDRWLGSPLLRSAQDLSAQLDRDGRLWLVVDEGRLRTRFDPAFAQTAWLRMALVAQTEGVLVFLANNPPPPAVSGPVDAVFGGQVSLVGYELGQLPAGPADPGWGKVVAHAGQTVPLTLYWQAVGPVLANYTLFVHLLGPDGQRYAQVDGPPLQGLQPMTHWQVGETLPDRWTLSLPADLAPGRYRLDVGLYDQDRLAAVNAAGQSLGDALTLDYVTVLTPGQSLPEPAERIDGDLTGNGDQVRLLGYTLGADVAAPGGTLALTLYWQAPGRIGSDYAVFVHLLDVDDEIRGQGDGSPVGGFYSTHFWDPGEIVVDEHLVTVAADAPAGTYHLAVGLYLAATGQRLASGAGDRLLLGQVEIRP